VSGSDTRIARHDFRRTKTLDRFHVHTISMVLESFARLATTPLSTVLRQPCSVQLVSLDQVTWADVSQSLDDTLHFVTFALPPAPGSSLLALPIAEALAIVDLRLAGSGEGDYPERMLTEVEQELLSPVVASVLDELRRAMARLQPIESRLEQHETHVQFVSIAAPGDTTLLARFDLTIGNRPASQLTMCLPLRTVRELVEGSADAGGGPSEAPDLSSDDSRRRLHEVPLDLVLQFPSFGSTPEALLNLAVGDEVHLGVATDRPLEVRAEGKLVAFATIGRSGVRKACCITEEVLT
jgi:flagellar motor switch protein FliM